MSDFDHIAWVYDDLARLVFANQVYISQMQYIHRFRPYDNVLILGGGTGKILSAMDDLNIPLNIVFVEPSEKMMKKAKRFALHFSHLTIDFHSTTFESFHSTDKYDWICCFYFLDVFGRESLIQTLRSIHQRMDDTSALIVADFQISQEKKTWQVWMSHVMHVFFKLAAKLESNRLQNLPKAIIDQGFVLHDHQVFFHQFIFSGMYRKNVPKNGNHS